MPAYYDPTFAVFSWASFPSHEYAVASARHASGSFVCSCVLFSAFLTAVLVVEPPPEPKMLKLPRRRSPRPVEPDPTPKKTKPAAKTNARKTKTHFAWRRRRGKNIVDSMLGGLRAAACFLVLVWGFFAVLRRA